MALRLTPAAVSVIIPAYNAEVTLRATLESLRAQTLRDFEAVVVDDGSRDATCEVATRIAKFDRRFSVITQAHAGVAAARNVAIAATSAPFVAALDADDLWHPTFLERLSAALESKGHDTVLAYANARVIDMSNCVLEEAPSYQYSGWVFNQLLLGNFIGNGSGTMFRRDCAVRIGGYDSRLEGSEDWLFALRLAAHGKFAGVGEYLVGYRVVPGQLSANTLMMRRSRLAALKLLFSEVGGRNAPAARWALGTAHAKCALHEIHSGLIGRAFISLFHALRLDSSGTCRLLFGPERLRWLREVFGRTAEPVAGCPFLSLDPTTGQWDQMPPRIEMAQHWDTFEGAAMQLARKI